MADRDLALNLIARTQHYNSGMREAAKETQSYQKQTQTAAKFTREMGRSMSMAGRQSRDVSGKMSQAQMAATQMTFAIDDAASVYGTTGLAGAVRASANNLTMVAMLMGGLKAQIAATAVMVGVQLWMAFDKADKKVQDANESLKRYQKIITSMTSRELDSSNFTAGLADIGSNKEATKQIADRRREMEVLIKTTKRLQLEQDGAKRKLAGTRDAPSYAGELARGILLRIGIAEKTKEQLELEKKLAASAEARKKWAEDGKILQEQITQNKAREQAIQNELNQLEERRFQIAKEQQAERSKEAALLLFQMIKQRIKDSKEKQEQVKQIRDEVLAINDPKKFSRQQIEEDRQRRLDALKGQKGKGVDDLIKAIHEAADKQLSELDKKERKAVRITGPTSALKGSREAMEIQRRMIIGNLTQKDEMPAIAKQQLNQQKIQTRLLKKSSSVNTMSLVVGAFTGGA